MSHTNLARFWFVLFLLMDLLLGVSLYRWTGGILPSLVGCLLLGVIVYQLCLETLLSFVHTLARKLKATVEPSMSLHSTPVQGESSTTPKETTNVRK